MPSRTELANAIRALSMDAVQKAKSGHPGMPMGMAEIAQVLWTDFLSHNPANPHWPDRDRFILSNGHGSILHYALLHLSGYALPMSEIERFRQLHSMTPGHPERGYAPGIETTTGPLGQGLANGVGMALAERMLGARFNLDGHEIVNHHTFVFAGDGCLMEGISHEACSLAGTLGLDKLIVIYDDNGISIDGKVDGWFTDDTPARFRAYGWRVIEPVDGHDAGAIAAALSEAKESSGKPTIVCCKTVIGRGSPGKQGTDGVHGSALGEAEVAATREAIGWHHRPFHIPDEIYAGWDARERGAAAEQNWRERFDAYRVAHPALAAEFERRCAGELPAEWPQRSASFVREVAEQGASIASRAASQNAIEALAPLLPELVGGSADLTGSNNTNWSGSKPVTAADASGNYIYFGVREFAMTAVANGMTLHGAMIPYCGTFLMFSEYARNAIRMAALMKTAPILVYTHDSIGLGEDGPTHQAVEQAASLRLVPGLSLWRPCDAVESAAAWVAAIEGRDRPTCLLFSRQSLPHQSRTPAQIDSIKRGGYVLCDCDGEPELIVIATGSEVGLAMSAASRLVDRGARVRVVSMPCVDVFEQQDAGYRERVLPEAVTARVVIEAGVTAGWHKYAGSKGRIVGIDSFGESAPAQDVFRHFGFTVENVLEIMQSTLQ